MVPLVPYKPCCHEGFLSATMQKIGNLKADWRSSKAGSLAPLQNKWMIYSSFVLSEKNGGKLSVSTLSCFLPQFLFSKIDIYYRKQTKYVFFPSSSICYFLIHACRHIPAEPDYLLWGNGGLKSHTANSKQLWRKFTRSSLTHPERALLWLRRSSLIPTLLKTVA